MGLMMKKFTSQHLFVSKVNASASIGKSTLTPNSLYVASRILPANNPITDRPLDLSHAVLRSVSAVHVEYMKNMGQAASMSISLLKDGQLWGLISCHHQVPRYLNYDTRVAAEFIGQMVSSQIVALEDAAEIDHRLQLKALYAELLNKGGSLNDVPNVLVSDYARLLSLTDAHGAAIIFGNEIRTVGRTPTVAQIALLRQWLEQRDETQFETDHLVSTYPGAADFLETGAGILSVQIPRGENGMILWFKSQM
jgi:chemotaxis family two-component system sensor kinase Cph1